MALVCQQQLTSDMVGCREMLRIKRSVAASFSQVHYNTTLVEAATTPAAPGRLPCVCVCVCIYQRLAHRARRQTVRQNRGASSLRCMLSSPLD